MAIDWTFICAEEGGQQLVGYVPLPDSSQSGVTIATGVDIGQRTKAEIEALPISGHLKEKLKPYCEVRRRDAVVALKRTPLAVTVEEANELDGAVQAHAAATLCAVYDNQTAQGCGPFHTLPADAQTVIASVAFHYGTNLHERTPRFWAAVTAQDWAAAVAELRNFGDKFPARRNREADRLASLVGETSRGGGPGDGREKR